MKHYQLLIVVSIGFVAGYLVRGINVPIEAQNTENKGYVATIIDNESPELVKYSETNTLTNKIDV